MKELLNEWRKFLREEDSKSSYKLVDKLTETKETIPKFREDLETAEKEKIVDLTIKTIPSQESVYAALNKPDFKLSDIDMSPRQSKKSKPGRLTVGLYSADKDVVKKVYLGAESPKYGAYLYEIKLKPGTKFVDYRGTEPGNTGFEASRIFEKEQKYYLDKSVQVVIGKDRGNIQYAILDKKIISEITMIESAEKTI